MRKRSLAFAPLAALAVIASACGSSSSTKAASTTAATTATTAAAAAGTTAASAATTAGSSAATTAAAKAVDLKAAGCPDPMVIQTDWFPEADHGWTYELIGQNGTADPKLGTYAGKVGGITIEARAGGPFINNASPSNQIYASMRLLPFQWRLVGKLMMYFGPAIKPVWNTNILPGRTSLRVQAFL